MYGTALERALIGLLSLLPILRNRFILQELHLVKSTQNRIPKFLPRP
jgi:hypothetical protein